MKKQFTLLALVITFASTLMAQAPSYTDIEWDIVRFGYAIPNGDGVSGGIAISTEPRYNLKDNISLGLRYELAIFGSEVENESIDIGAAGSIALMADYYFSNTSSKRAFVGLGLGSFAGASSTVTVNGMDIEADGGSSIGLIPRVGYEFGHLRLSAEYNLAFKEEVSNYIGIHLGITLFGGYDG